MRLQRISRQTVLRGFVLVVRLALGAMFIASSLPKIRLPYAFLSDVYGYELVGPKLGVLVAMTLPWIELFVGICLVGGIFIGGALLASVAMGAMFTFVLASALYRHLDISCGCFSSAAGKISYMTLIRAISITLFSAAAYAATILLAPRQWLAPPAPAEEVKQDSCVVTPLLDAGA
jgi:hypothetical protein